jgi:bifunctional oligoribonuclease and PAP phosphatase NrnA
MIDATEIQAFKAAVDNAKTVFISAHVGPDGDTLGSMLGLKHAFERNVPHLTRVDCVISGKMPDAYKFMPGIADVKDVDRATDLLEQYDLAFSVDCGSAERLGLARTRFLNATQSINIDHHVSNNRFGKINIIDVEAGASGEVVADLLMGCGMEISPAAATCMYVAILTDTGGFKYSSTSAKIFELVATLTRNGANPENIYRHIYEEVPKVQVMLHAEVLQRAKFNQNSTLAWGVVTQDLMNEFDATEENVEGLAESLRRIDTVLVSAILRENKAGQTKVSLRSDVSYISVVDVVERWHGGGHKMAAGCTIEKSPVEAEKDLIPLLEELIRQATLRPV